MPFFQLLYHTPPLWTLAWLVLPSCFICFPPTWKLGFSSKVLPLNVSGTVNLLFTRTVIKPNAYGFAVFICNRSHHLRLPRPRRYFDQRSRWGSLKGSPGQESIDKRGIVAIPHFSEAKKILKYLRFISYYRFKHAVRTSSASFGHVFGHFGPLDVVRPVITLVLAFVCRTSFVCLVDALFYVFFFIAKSSDYF